MRAILIFSLLIIIFPLAANAALMYSSDEIRGTIVDGETDQPIEGAVVVANWTVIKMILWPTAEGGKSEDFVTLEAVTDREGKYVIPAWGPKPISPLKVMESNSAHITIYKIGYWNKYLSDIEPETFTKRYDVSKLDNKQLIQKGRSFTTQFEEAVANVTLSTHEPAPSHRRSVWNGKTIRLKKFVFGDELKFEDIQRVVLDSTGKPLRDEKGKIIVKRIPVTEKVTEKDLYDQIKDIAKTKNICRDILREEPKFSAEFINKYPVRPIFNECREILKEADK